MHRHHLQKYKILIKDTANLRSLDYSLETVEVVSVADRFARIVQKRAHHLNKQAK